MIICGNWKYAKAQWLSGAAELLTFLQMRVGKEKQNIFFNWK